MAKGFVIISLLILGCTSARLRTPPEGLAESASQERTPAVEKSKLPREKTCEEFIHSLPSSMTWGYLDVPKDWFNSTTQRETLRIFYYAKIVENASGNNLPPILLMDGGPGLPDWYLYASLVERLKTTKTSVVFMDPRGTGCSTRYPTRVPPHPEISLSHFDSRQVVMDAERIRQHLFGESGVWRLYGISNGGLVANRYITMKPEHLSAVYINSFGLLKNKAEYPLRYKATVLEKVKAFFKTYPYLEEKLLDWLRADLAQSCASGRSMNECVMGALPEEFFKMVFDASRWPQLKSAITALTSNDHLETIKPKKNAPPTIFEAAVATIARADYIDYAYSEQDPFHCKPFDKKFMESVPLQYLAFIPRCEELSDHMIALYAKLKRMPDTGLKLTDVKKSLDQFPNIGFHIFGGEKDMYVPPNYNEDEREFLGPRLKYTLSPGRRHSEPRPEIYKLIFGEE